LKELVTKNVSRPLRILFQEPIVLLVSIYVSLSLLSVGVVAPAF
jgi:hypothetical protein